MTRARIAVAALSLSFSAGLGILYSENYTDGAVIPVAGDRPTFGFGSTFKEGGKPVLMGDRTTPIRALHIAQEHLSKEENAFRDSLPGVELNQPEYDLYVDWLYQYGSGAWLKSSMRRELLKGTGGHYAACKALLAYRFVAAYDCQTPGNKRCGGVWTRQLDRFAQCYAAQ